jgi:L-asparaginase II
VHADLAAAMLAKAGQVEAALACGAHEPSNEAAANALIRAGRLPSQLHNNCSGKHAGMVCTCVHAGDPVAGYLDVGHPHQRRIARVLADFCGDAFDARSYGIDGCSAPNWALPLGALAGAFARYTTGEGLAPRRRDACARITRACISAPDMVAGPGRLDTNAMRALAGAVFMKTGAEGVYCGAFPARGLGFAVKIDDGNKRASEAVVAGLIARLYPSAGDFGALGAVRNWRGTEVGDIRLADAATRLFDRLG